MKPIILSYGGGTQSIATVCLIAQGKLPKPEQIVFADTGRERTSTFEYTNQYIIPILDSIGLNLEIVPHGMAKVDLYSYNGDCLIPAFTRINQSKGQMRNFCSNEWKRLPIRRYLRSMRYGPKNPVELWIGISLDEIGRAKPSSVKWIEHQWPLLFLLSPAIRRSDCIQIVTEYGLPAPPKSSCWCCPYARDAQWRDLKNLHPADFEKAIQLDEQIREKDKSNAMYLHHSAIPLAEVNFEPRQQALHPLFGEVDGCDSGFCWT